MDRELTELKRAVDADPGNEELTRRFERALLRTGQRKQVAERYRFKFLCELRLEDLERTPDPWIHHCSTCERNVQFVTTGEELARRVAAGECVAVVTEALSGAFDQLVDARELHTAEEAGRPCVLGYAGYPRRRIKMGKVQRIPD